MGSRSRASCSAFFLVFLGSASAELGAQLTDFDGNITTDAWLVLGPFTNDFGCQNNGDLLLGNHIAPAHIACEYPVEGDEVEFDPFESVADDYLDPTGLLFTLGGEPPVWRRFDEFGFGTGDINLDGDVNGDLNDVMSWLVTYVEYAGDAPVAVDLCIGSDDDVQVWIDENLVWNNPACRGRNLNCQDRAGVLIEPGVHRIAMGIWENAGGWGGSLALLQNNQPVVDGETADWTFLGVEGEIETPEDCEGPEVEDLLELSPVTGLNCEGSADTGVDLTWTNPPGNDPGVEIRIFNGETLKTVPGDATTATIEAGELDPEASICVVNYSGLASCCSLSATTAIGQIKSSRWLVLGPFSTTVACDGNPGLLLQNQIAPAIIGCEYPRAGDPIEYDPFEAATDGYVGPTDADDFPFWRRFDDGSDDGNHNLDADADTGPQSQVMSWLATYVEYTGADLIDIELCVGSDDDVQVWINQDLVHNMNRCAPQGDCQDRVPYTVPGPGIYRIAMGVWEEGGGWAGRFSLEEGGLPILDDGTGDWIFHGRNPPPDFVAPECVGCPPEPVTNLTCEFGQVGFGEGLILTWENPETIDLAVPTTIEIDGVEVGEVASDATRANLPGPVLPDGAFVVSVTHCGGLPAFCSPFNTDAEGLILGQAFLALGPISTAINCAGSPDELLGNHIAPSFIGCEYPEEGDETRDGVDFFDPDNVALGFHPSTEERWRPFDDGSPADGDQDLDADIAGDVSDHMSWLVTYVEYLGDPADFTLCIGSDDDVQVWLDDQLVHNNNSCRARGVCQDQVFVQIEPGVHRLAMAVWENGGGWGGSLGLRDEFGLPIIDGESDEWIFHGRNRPGAPEDFPCGSFQLPVDNLECSADGEGSAEITWDNPEENDPEQEITITVNGEEAVVVAGDTTSATVELDDGLNSICVENGAFGSSCCGVFAGEELYINCGGPEFIDASGRVWTEDSGAMVSPFLVSGPNTATFNAQPVNLDADEIVQENEYPAEVFQEERWNDGPLEYAVTGLPRGDYEVTLLFMEGCCSDGCEDIDDPALSAGGCRVFDILVNDELVEDQFSQNVEAARTAGTLPGTDSYYIGIGRAYEVQDVDSIRILIEDLGGGNPPENASLKGIAIVRLGAGGASLKPGDVNGDGGFNIADMVAELGFLFGGSRGLPACFLVPGSDPPMLNETGFAIFDFNGDGSTNIADAVAGLSRLFGGGGPHVLGEGCAVLPGPCASNCVQ